MKTVPRLPERVLSALGASEYFRDDVLGDLAQEFEIRADFDVRGARRWYYREAWRAAPYMLRNGLRNLRARDLFGLASAVVVALAGAVVFRNLFFRMLLEIGVRGNSNFLRLWSTAPVFLLVNGITPVAGGYIAAWMHRRAPLLGAVALGIAWAALDITVIASVGADWPAFYRYTLPWVALVFSSLGGLLRVWNRRPFADSAAPR